MPSIYTSIAGALASACSAGDHPPAYTVTILPPLQPPHALFGGGAVAVDAAGRIVGSTTAGNTIRATRWIGGIPFELPGLPGDLRSDARGVNDDGTVVGFSSEGTLATPAAVRWVNGQVEALPWLTGFGSVANGINTAGTIVGYAETPDGYWTATKWDAAGATTLPLPTGHTHSGARAVNRNGLIVGWSTREDSTSRPIAWRDGKLVQLPVAARMWHSAAIDVNDAGDILGYAHESPLQLEAYVWKDGNRITLPTFGENASYPSAINNSGHVVGTAEKNSDPTGYLWDGTALHDLQDLLAHPTRMKIWTGDGISDEGWILGSAIVGLDQVWVVLKPLD